MEIKILRTDLSKAVSLAGGVASSKTSPLPILSNILIEASQDGKLRLVGTDLEIGISTTVPAHVEKEGCITLPARKFAEIVHEIPEGEVEILVAKNHAVTIRAGRAYFKIMGLAKDDFPTLPEWSADQAVIFEQSAIKESLALTVFAVSSDESRYVLNGTLVSMREKKLRFVATDGRRLAFIEKELPSEPSRNFEIIIPMKAVQELLKLLAWEGTVGIINTQNHAIFNLGDTFLTSRLIEGHFPDYEQVIPKERKTTTTTNREEFLRAIRRTALLTSADSPAVKLDFLHGKILVSSRSPNLGEAREELPAEVSGNEVAIGFNPYYLIDALKNLDIEKISLSLTGPDKPGLVSGKDGYLYVVMPMQLS